MGLGAGWGKHGGAPARGGGYFCYSVGRLGCLVEQEAHRRNNGWSPLSTCDGHFKVQVPSLWHVLWFFHSYWLHSSLTIQLGLKNHSHNLLKSPELRGPPTSKQKPGRLIHELTSRSQLSPKDLPGDRHLVRRVGVAGRFQPLM